MYSIQKRWVKSIENVMKKYFKQPDIIEFDLRHEELLLDASR